MWLSIKKHQLQKSRKKSWANWFSVSFFTKIDEAYLLRSGKDFWKKSSSTTRSTLQSVKKLCCCAVHETQLHVVHYLPPARDTKNDKWLKWSLFRPASSHFSRRLKQRTTSFLPHLKEVSLVLRPCRVQSTWNQLPNKKNSDESRNLATKRTTVFWVQKGDFQESRVGLSCAFWNQFEKVSRDSNYNIEDFSVAGQLLKAVGGLGWRVATMPLRGIATQRKPT